GDRDGGGNQIMENVRGLAVTAVSYDDYLTIAAGAGVGADVGIGGSVTVNTLTETTTASIGGAQINPDNSGATNAAQGVLVRADDDTKLISVAGGIQYGGSAGVGAGVDVGVITKHTTAAVAQNANVKLLGNMRVNADSEENIIS